MNIENTERFRGKRIDSWKEIGAFFGRSERTVKRWEAERGLPVCRVPGGGKTSVYAYPLELEAWLRTSQATGDESDLQDCGPTVAASVDGPQIAGAVSMESAVSKWRKFRLPLVICLLAGLVVAAVLAYLREAASERTNSGTSNLAASNLYLKGVYSWQTRTPAGLAQAVADFRNAILVDPRFASAYAGLADCYNLMPEYSDMPASIAFPKAREAAERAIRLDSSIAGAHRSLAFADFWWFHDVAGAMREFKRAMALEPHSAQTHHWYANALAMTGNSRAALLEIATAENLAPGITAIMADQGMLLVDAGRLEEGVQLLKQIETAQPEFAPTHAYLARAFGLAHLAEPLLQELRWHARLKRDAGESAVATAGAEGLAQGGEREMRRRMVQKEGELLEQDKFSAYQLAIDDAALGDRDRVLPLLDRAVRSNDTLAMGMRTQPAFLFLHDDPRFARLLAREGFAPFD